MRSVRHSDNSCTVGWTSISGTFDADDVALMHEVCPEGYLIPTFLVPRGHGPKREGERTTTTDWIEWLRKGGLHGSKAFTFYYTFPLGPNGEVLLVVLYQRYGMELWPEKPSESARDKCLLGTAHLRKESTDAM